VVEDLAIDRRQEGRVVPDAVLDEEDDLDADGLRDFLVAARDAGVAGRGMGYLCSTSGSGVFRSFFPEPSAVDMGYFFSDAIGEDVFASLSLEGSVAARDHAGGTAPKRVSAAVARARARRKVP